MIPATFFFANAKYPDKSDNAELNEEDIATLNRIFLDFCNSLDSTNLSEKARKSTIYNSDGRLNIIIKRGLESLSSKFFSKDMAENLISKLQKSGFIFKNATPKFILSSFKDFIKDSLTDIAARPAALNCYDYIRLKDELEVLYELNPSFVTKLPTLQLLIKEVDQAEKNNSDYPIRPFPFNRLTDRSAWSYQCLRIMDEILYTIDSPIPTTPDEKYIYNYDEKNDMLTEILSTCRRLGIEPKPLSRDTLRKHFVTLRNLINVEFTGSFRKAYSNDDIYVYSQGHGHQYALMKKREEPVTAFKLCFSLSEARRIANQLNVIMDYLEIDGELNRYSFYNKFPLLSALASINKYEPGRAKGSVRLNGLSGKQTSSLYTLNYLPPKEQDTKNKIENALNSSIPMSITINSGDKKGSYLPISLNEQGLKWSLLARETQTGLLHNIQPSEFGNDLTISPCQEKLSLKPEENYIGLGDFLLKRKTFSIDLILSTEGYRKINQCSHPLFPIMIKNESVKWKKMVTLNAYLNDDFFEELNRLDRNRDLKDIFPVEVKNEYLSFVSAKKGMRTGIPK